VAALASNGVRGNPGKGKSKTPQPQDDDSDTGGDDRNSYYDEPQIRNSNKKKSRNN